MLYKYSRQPICVFLILLLGLNSCTKHETKSKLAEYGSVFENVMLTDTGTFRGFNLGDKLDSIQKKEIAKLTEVDESYLYYESKMDTTGSYSISYTFDETGLNEIQSYIFITNPNNTDTIFSQFKSYFDKHYGPSETHMGYIVWTVRSEKYDVVRINLSDESTGFTIDKAPGKISLWIYPNKD